MNDLADLIREQATAMNMSAANAYDAGLNEGFRRGINRAAELVAEQINAYTIVSKSDTEEFVALIRALKLKP